MALGINTNVASINAQNQLGKSQSQNDQALERLSSGLRINSAKDDAAGLAISTRFEAQINGLNQASRNSNDGISLAQTAEGGLDEITNNLQRVRELSVQSANATNNASDRQALNDEVQQRLEEIDRIASETDFNGLNVLDGSLKQQDFQVGANVGQTIGVDLEEGARTSQLGELAEADISFSGDSGKVGLSIGDAEAENIDISSNESAVDIADKIEGVSGINEATAKNEQTIKFEEIEGTTDDAGSVEFQIDVGSDVSETFTLNYDDADGDTISASDVAAEIKSQGIEGLSVEEDGDDITFTTENGENLSLTQTDEDDNVDGTLGTDAGFDGVADDSTEEFVGQVSVQASDDLNVVNDDSDAVVDDVVIDGNSNSLDAGEEKQVDATGSLEDVNVLDVPAANDAIRRIDASLDSVNSIRSELGAVQNRFESTIANLDNNTENLEASNSRIKDADFASESAKLSQSQVLQQAGISVLSQANQRPQQVLSLLQ